MADFIHFNKYLLAKIFCFQGILLGAVLDEYTEDKAQLSCKLPQTGCLTTTGISTLSGLEAQFWTRVLARLVPHASTDSPSRSGWQAIPGIFWLTDTSLQPLSIHGSPWCPSASWHFSSLCVFEPKFPPAPKDSSDWIGPTVTQDGLLITWLLCKDPTSTQGHAHSYHATGKTHARQVRGHSPSHAKYPSGLQ